MRDFRSSLKASVVAGLLLLSQFSVFVPSLKAGSTLENNPKLAPDVIAKIAKYKAQRNRAPADGLFDLLQDLLRSTRASDKGSALTREERVQLIVQTTEPTIEADLAAVEELGGHIITPSFAAINGMVVELPVSQIERFAISNRVGRIAVDRQIHFLDHIKADFGVESGKSHILQTTGANQFFPGNSSGKSFTGNGIGIAVIDSGITQDEDDFNEANPNGINTKKTRIEVSENFSSQPGTQDGLGHGTHVAGLAAGAGTSSIGTNDFYGGIAPMATIYSFRVFTNTGEGKVSEVIRALDWIISNRVAKNIRVINLSLGTPIVESYKTDPLCLAVERAVDAGINVVVAAGNFGKDGQGNTIYSGILSPANHPKVITVGAANTFGTNHRSDDTVTTYSSRGPTAIDYVAKPDLVAPGNKIISVAAPNNYLLGNWPGTKSSTPGYMVLSGSSMAAPIVAGGVALMLQANPSLTPRIVKAILKVTAQPLSLPGLTFYQRLVTEGCGEVNIAAAVNLAEAIVGNANQLKRGQSLLKNGQGLSSVGSTILISGEQVPLFNPNMIATDGVLFRNGLSLFDAYLIGREVAIENGTLKVGGQIAGSGLSLFDGFYVSDGYIILDRLKGPGKNSFFEGLSLFDGTTKYDGLSLFDSKPPIYNGLSLFDCLKEVDALANGTSWNSAVANQSTLPSSLVVLTRGE